MSPSASPLTPVVQSSVVMDLGLRPEQPLGINSCIPITRCQLKIQVKQKMQEARELAQSVKSDCHPNGGPKFFPYNPHKNALGLLLGHMSKFQRYMESEAGTGTWAQIYSCIFVGKGHRKFL